MTRIGIGYDIHALKKGRKLILGSVVIPFGKGLYGHSDGDVLYHAIVDAVLGAAGEQDLGDLFSDKDPEIKDASSLLFVNKAREVLKKKRLKIVNIDAIILAEAPKLLSWKEKVRKSVALAFGVAVSQVGIKAKTNEGFGAVGRNEAIACHAAVSLAAIGRK